MSNLTSVEIRLPESGQLPAEHPFAVPAVRALVGDPLTLAQITFLVGENGSGKSTLLEGLAYACDLPAVGFSDIATDPTLRHARTLGDRLTLRWRGARNRRGLFLRAEDFFGFARRMDAMQAEFKSDLEQLRDDDSISDRSRSLAMMAPSRELGEIQRRYGEGIDTQSHGEQFLHLFGQRLVPGGLHLLDEPETPLSPARQLSLMSMIMHVAREEASQFIIATHSPLLMAIPGATIYHFDEAGIRAAEWDALDHVTITRDFLLDPQAFLRFL